MARTSRIFILCFFLSLHAAFAAKVDPKVLAEAEAKRFTAALEDFRQGRYLDSQAELGRLTHAHPQVALYWLNLGSANYMLKEDRKAVLCFRQVLRLKSPLIPLARVQLSKALRRLGEVDLAFEVFEPLRAGPAPAEIGRALEDEAAQLEHELLLRAFHRYEERDYDQALQYADQARVVKPLPEDRMLAGMALLKENRLREARVQLLLAEPAKIARDFISQIDEEEPRSARALSLDLGAEIGLDSNDFAVGQGGLSRLLSHVAIDGGYHLVRGDYFKINAQYSFRWEEVWNVFALRFFDQRLRVPMAYRDPVWLFEFAPEYQYQILDKDPFLSTPVVAARVQRSFGQHDVGLGYSGHFHQSLVSQYSGLTGFEQRRRVYWLYNMIDALLTVSYWSLDNRVGDLIGGGIVIPMANNAHGPSLDFTWQMSERWGLEADASYLFVHYLNASQPGSVVRDDKTLELYFRLAFELTRKWKLHFSTQAIVNASTMNTTNLNSKDYSQVFVLGGFSYALF